MTFVGAFEIILVGEKYMKRTLLEQYMYETQERGLSHEDALEQMKYMFSKEDLEALDMFYKLGK